MTAMQALQHPWLKSRCNLSKTNPQKEDEELQILHRLRSFKRLRKLKKEAIKIMLRMMEEN